MASSSLVRFVLKLRPVITLSSRTFCASRSNEGENTHFGFQTVTREEKAQKVHQVFSKVAAKYDLMNDVMSAGIHRLWKNHFVNQIDTYSGLNALDVAGGTGDIAFRILEKASRFNHDCSVTICDINGPMLQEGKRRAEERGMDKLGNLSWVEGDAMNLQFEDNTFDCYTIAFGIRNVVDIPAALSEAHRVLKPGGLFHCLEFSRPVSSLLTKPYDWYSFNIIPIYGEVFAGDWASYQYLVESIRKFPDQEDFKHMIESMGFKLVNYENLFQGVACIHQGFKALAK